MSFGLAVAIRNTRLNAIRNAIDAGAGPGTAKIYAGTRPATGGAVGGATLLATLTFSDPSSPDASGGVATYSVINPDTAADASGNAAWMRIEDSTGAFVADASVSVNGGGGEAQFVTVGFVAGQQIGFTSFVLTEGNA